MNSTIQGLNQIDEGSKEDLLPIWDSSALSYNTKKITLAQLLNALIPVSTTLPFMGTIAPQGFLMCDGSEYLGSNYPNLYPVLKDLPACHSDREGYFKVPDLKGKFIQGSDENLGEDVGAGIPNITGSLSLVTGRDGWQPSGEFLDTVHSYNFSYSGYSSSGSGRVFEIKTNASKGETKLDGELKTDMDYKVYGKSETVQPPAVTMNYIIKF